MNESLTGAQAALRALAAIPLHLEEIKRLMVTEFSILRQEIRAMSVEVDTIQQETTGLQSHWAGVKAALAAFQGAMTVQLAALQDQITALQGAGVDPALLTPLASLQTDMQATTDGLAALTNPPAPTPTPTPTPTA